MSPSREYASVDESSANAATPVDRLAMNALPRRIEAVGASSPCKAARRQWFASCRAAWRKFDRIFFLQVRGIELQTGRAHCGAV
jgi:hypothetical protein